MTKARDIAPSPPPEAPLAASQRAAARLQIGERFYAVAEVEVTPAGLLAIGGMVGAILLGAAAVVRAARR
ncbi:hypothetical protein FHS95_001140 [Sphingomonas naasensis]|uniref:hypothetical protein n=1 Tax=Sphingomonas naasensis TaxID=1344951 RepID=UPI00141AD15A|nr:hypothetical protein [Sphingomonas naasensis]NIJ19471.1 hypothetical protein [Sphingomonas naasensis]